MISFKPCIWLLPVNGYTTVWHFPKCNAKCICVFGFYSPFRLSCFPNLLLFFNSPGRQLVTIYSAFALMLLFCFFLNHEIDAGFECRLRPGDSTKYLIRNRSTLHGTAVQSHRLRLPYSRLVKWQEKCYKKETLMFIIEFTIECCLVMNIAKHWHWEYSKRKTSFRNEKSWDLGNTRDKHRKNKSFGFCHFLNCQQCVTQCDRQNILCCGFVVQFLDVLAVHVDQSFWTSAVMLVANNERPADQSCGSGASLLAGWLAG